NTGPPVRHRCRRFSWAPSTISAEDARARMRAAQSLGRPHMSAGPGRDVARPGPELVRGTAHEGAPPLRCETPAELDAHQIEAGRFEAAGAAQEKEGMMYLRLIWLLRVS